MQIKSDKKLPSKWAMRHADEIAKPLPKFTSEKKREWIARYLDLVRAEVSLETAQDALTIFDRHVPKN